MTDAAFRALAKQAARRYPVRDRTARHFAYGKLTRDPVFAYLLRERLIPAQARLLDLGCGQGVLAALLAAAGIEVRSLRGIDLSRRGIARARAAFAEGEFVEGDIRATPFGAADRVVILDVLHYIDHAAQEDVLRRVRESLAAGGLLLLRVADASASLRFRVTVMVDRVVTALRGHGFGPLYSRPLAQWIALLQGLGFRVAAEPMSHGTPFANVLLVGRYDPRATSE